MLHSRKSNNKINRIHERALRLIYNDSRTSFEELLVRDQSYTIDHQNIQQLLIEIYKSQNGLDTEIIVFVVNLVFLYTFSKHCFIRTKLFEIFWCSNMEFRSTYY